MVVGSVARRRVEHANVMYRHTTGPHAEWDCSLSVKFAVCYCANEYAVMKVIQRRSPMAARHDEHSTVFWSGIIDAQANRKCVIVRLWICDATGAFCSATVFQSRLTKHNQ